MTSITISINVSFSIRLSPSSSEVTGVLTLAVPPHPTPSFQDKKASSHSVLEYSLPRLCPSTLQGSTLAATPRSRNCYCLSWKRSCWAKSRGKETRGLALHFLWWCLTQAEAGAFGTGWSWGGPCGFPFRTKMRKPAAAGNKYDTNVLLESL